MKTLHVCTALSLCGAALTAIGCWDAYAEFYVPLSEIEGSGGTAGTGGTGGTTTVDPGCVPSNTSTPVDDDCGVFVSAAGDNKNSGKTKSAPKKTLAAALEIAKGLPIYLCTDGVSEALTLTEDATIYGGLDCSQEWKYAGLEEKSPWTAADDEVPLRLAAGVRAAVFDVAFVAVDAKAEGGSSIGIIAEVGTQLELERCEVTVGNGAMGAAGEEPLGTGVPGTEGAEGTGGCDSDMGEFGGSGGQLTCDVDNVAGGDGGPGTKNSTGGAGSPGLPIGAAGIAGFGQGVSVDCMTDGNGGAGAPGMPGEAGFGAPQTLGTLGPEGFAGVSGESGKSGKPGQGGGGGGGGKVCANAKAGPSGGGGGSGGCGGTGGKGGKGGGSSIGIVLLGSKLTLDSVKITAKNGGNGGAGAVGQPGGAGGVGGGAGPAEGGAGTATACAGGKGGDGGPGGKGGGGLGGHSIGIAYSGDAPSVKGATIAIGTSGKGGEGDGSAGAGAAGVSEETREF